MNSPTAFTLIEMLVVVTIIVVLMSLLTPALDRAVYQAQLALCGSRLKAMGTATMTYAAANRRQYMERYLDAATQPIHVRQKNPNTESRLTLGKAFPMDLLNDPLAQSVDIDGGNIPDFGVQGYKPVFEFQVFGSYNIFVNWRYLNGKAMRRVGDRFNWTFGGFEREYDILFSDRDVVMPTENESQSSHPDRLDLMNNIVARNEASPWKTSYAAKEEQAFNYITISLWRMQGNYRRGVVDNNYLHEDLAVARYNDVVADAAEDPRMSRVPIWQGNHTIPDTNGWIQLPR